MINQDEKITAFVQQTAQRALDELDGVGAGVSVVKSGKVVCSVGAGFADLSNKKPFEPSNTLNIGSISKVIAVQSLLALEADGHEILDRYVKEVIPEFELATPGAADLITFKHIASYSTGTNLTQLEYYFFQSGLTKDGLGEYFSFLKGLEVDALPGSRYSYCNELFALIGIAVERITGKHWSRYVDERILSAPNLQQVWSNYSGIIGSPVKYYQKDDAGRFIAIRRDYMKKNSRIQGVAGGVHASVSGVGEWLAYAMNPERASAVYGISVEALSDMDALWTPDRLDVRGRAPEHDAFDRGGDGHGLGWHLHRFRGATLVQKTGANPGIRSIAAYLPKSKVGCAVVANADNRPLPTALALHILDQLAFPEEADDWIAYFSRLPEEDARTQRVSSIPPAGDLLERLCGTWQMAPPRTTVLNVSTEDGDVRMSSGPFTWAITVIDPDRLEFRMDCELLGPAFLSGSGLNQADPWIGVLDESLAATWITISDSRSQTVLFKV